MLKKELRIKYKELRQKLSLEEIEEKSLAIANQLLKLDIWDNTYFHIFLPIEEQKEVNSEFILNILQAKDKEIVISRSDFETTSMHHILLTDNTKIKKNEYNIPEPINGLSVPAEMIDVVFVPLLAYDKQGNRVGYGKGFYDKFLSKCRPNVVKIGLSFFETEELIEDVFENDIKLDFCVNTEQIIRF
ncbi:5-formyltetrahydrofolate cyclo-ligase [Flavobacterium gelidilacus]|jgi:5-formyltetrahydrofolate cyclo-ligase|uniref:5-formyltetrahydrofolate cyclo-ligase n=1 Tax=Flavobacterium gelidilacus TaxID=206041 RepID=UPI00042914BC|nr:5-formyltetrahydrofolate cyclo-ligase [Flavobacterium gelidilacus]